MGEEWLHLVGFSHPDAHRPEVARPGPEMNRCETLTDIQNSPQPCHDRSNKICYTTKKPYQPTTDPGKQEV